MYSRIDKPNGIKESKKSTASIYEKIDSPNGMKSTDDNKTEKPYFNVPFAGGISTPRPTKTGEMLSHGAQGAAQSFLNTPEEGANVFGKHLYNKFNFAPKDISAKAGGVIGDIASFSQPELVLNSLIKTIGFIPKAGKYINALKEGLKARPIINALLKTGKNAAQGGLFEKEKSPNASGVDVAKASVFSGLVPTAISAIGATNPLVSLAAKMGIGGALGYQANGLPGIPEGAAMGVAAPKIMKEMGVLKGSPVSSEFLTEQPNALAHARYEAGNHIGAPVRPSEAFDSPAMGANEGQVSNTEVGNAAMAEHAKERVEKQRRSISNLLNKIYPKNKKAANKIRDLYEKSYQKNLTDNEVYHLFQDRILQKVNKNVLNDEAYAKDLGNVRINNLAYLDQLKRAMDDKINILKSSTKPQFNKARIYENSRDKLIKAMDDVSPDYALAREAAQKKIVRRDLEKALGTKEINGRNFFDKILRNDNKYEELLGKLKNSPEATQHIKYMKLAWEHLIGKDTVRTAAGMAAKQTSSARADATKFWNLFKDTVGAPRDIERANFIHDPKWWSRFDEVAKYKDRAKRTEKLVNLFGELSAPVSLEAAKLTERK